MLQQETVPITLHSDPAKTQISLACAQVDQILHLPPEAALDKWLPTVLCED